MKKKKILAIVGNSGSGKTSLGIALTTLCNGFNWICSYTTRDMRINEVNGVEHVFVKESDMPKKDRMVAYTLFGGNHYWTEFSQFLPDVINVYIIDEDGIEEMVMKYHGLFDLKTVYINRSDTSSIESDRVDRDKNRRQLPKTFYDLIIENDYENSSDFVKDGMDKILSLCDEWK